jgi:thiamine biosynthesis lipoprotein
MEQGLLSDEFPAMGTQVRVLLPEGSPQAVLAFDLARRTFTEKEARFSRFRPDSELSALNQSKGKPFHASSALYRLVSTALAFREETSALFDPTLLPELVANGYDRSFERLDRDFDRDRTATQTTRRLPIARAVKHPVTFDAEARTITLPAGAGIDLGGIAKGWTVDETCSLLPAGAPFLIDAGGDIYAGGAGPDGRGWTIAVADPFDDSRDVAILRIRSCGSVTGR